MTRTRKIKGAGPRLGMKFVYIEPSELKEGEYVEGVTSLISQKNLDYACTNRGYVIKTGATADKIKIETSKGKIKNLCNWVGDSGWNDVLVARPRVTFKQRQRMETTGRVPRNLEPSIDSSNASSKSSNASGSRSRSRSRSRGSGRKKKKRKPTKKIRPTKRKSKKRIQKEDKYIL